MGAPVNAVSQQVVWKNDEILNFAISLVRHALELSRTGTHKFTTDIVPDAERSMVATGGSPGHGIAGSVATMLKNASIIAPVGIFQNERYYAERAKSTRPESKGRWLNLYCLTSRALAEEFISRNGQRHLAAQVGTARCAVRATQQDLITETQSQPATAFTSRRRDVIASGR